MNLPPDQPGDPPKNADAPAPPAQPVSGVPAAAIAGPADTSHARLRLGLWEESAALDTESDEPAAPAQGPGSLDTGAGKSNGAHEANAAPPRIPQSDASATGGWEDPDGWPDPDSWPVPDLSAVVPPASAVATLHDEASTAEEVTTDGVLAAARPDDGVRGDEDAGAPPAVLPRPVTPDTASEPAGNTGPVSRRQHVGTVILIIGVVLSALLAGLLWIAARGGDHNVLPADSSGQPSPAPGSQETSAERTWTAPRDVRLPSGPSPRAAAPKGRPAGGGTDPVAAGPGSAGTTGVAPAPGRAKTATPTVAVPPAAAGSPAPPESKRLPPPPPPEAPSASPRSRPAPVIPATAGPTASAAPSDASLGDAEQLRRALAYYRAADYGNAEREYRALLARNDRHAEVRNNLGVVYLAQGHLDLAEAEFRSALGIEPRHGGARSNLGLTLLRRGQTAAAAAELRSAIELDPRNVQALINLALALKAARQPGEARAMLKRALDLDGRSAAAHYNLALLHDESGETVPAIEHYRQFLIHGQADQPALADAVRKRLEALGGSSS